MIDGSSFDEAILGPKSDSLPNDKSFSISLKVLQTFLNDFSLRIQYWQNISAHEQILMTLQVDSITNLSFWNQQLDVSVFSVWCTNDHAVWVESSQRPWF